MTTGRRLLLISYHFGPSGATGGFRWWAMTEHLQEHGWLIDVITAATDGEHAASKNDLRSGLHVLVVDPPRWGNWLRCALDWLRGAKAKFGFLRASRSGRPAARVMPSDVSLWTPVSQLSLSRRLLLSLEGLATLLAEWAWAWAAGKAAHRRCRVARPNVIVVSTPPHWSSVAAVRVAKKHGIPSVIDRRDPWILGIADDARFMDDDLQRILSSRWERRVLRSATMVVHNTGRARQTVTSLLPDRSHTAHVSIPNGYDFEERALPPDSTVFRIAFTGWLHPVMDVRVLFDAFARFRKRHRIAAGEMEVCFIGSAPEFGGVPMDGLAEAYGLRDVLRIQRRVSRQEAVALQESSAVLCAMDNRHPLAVPMKFYEYARLCGALLLIGNPDSALGDAAGRLGLRVFDSADSTGIDAHLDSAYERWKAGAMTTPLDSDGVFARRHQSQRMHELLMSLNSSG